VVRLFKEAIRLAVEGAEKPSNDFTEEVMRTLEYFDMKVGIRNVISSGIRVSLSLL